MSTIEKIALGLGIYAAAMAGLVWKFRLRSAFMWARDSTGDPHYD